MNIQQIPVRHIRRIREIQSRVEMDGETVQEYTAAMKDGEQFPPIVVFPDGNGGYVVADGFHRLNAAKNAKLETIAAEVHDGGPRDAILYSAGANIRHGLRRSNDDKRRAVLMLLEDSEWSRWSNREIARRTGVSDPTVAKYREELSAKNSQIDMFDDSRTVTRNGTTYEMKKKHWSFSYDNTFWSMVKAYGLEEVDVLSHLQKNAHALTDLEMGREEALLKLRQLAIAHHSETFKVGDYVRHATDTSRNGSRYGQVKAITPAGLDVLDLRIDYMTSWKIDACIPCTRGEYEAYAERTKRTAVATDINFREEVVVWADAHIATADPDGVYEPTMRVIREGTRLQFTKAFKQGKYSWVECNWGGGPTVLPLTAIKKAADYEPPKHYTLPDEQPPADGEPPESGHRVPAWMERYAAMCEEHTTRRDGPIMVIDTGRDVFVVVAPFAETVVGAMPAHGSMKFTTTIAGKMVVVFKGTGWMDHLSSAGAQTRMYSDDDAELLAVIDRLIPHDQEPETDARVERLVDLLEEAANLAAAIHADSDRVGTSDMVTDISQALDIAYTLDTREAAPE